MKTADELAAETAAQLEEMERKRVRRMRQRGSDEDDSDDDDAGRKGGYAAKRLKRAKQDTDEPRKARRQTVRCAAEARSACPDSRAHACLALCRRAQGDALDENFALGDAAEGGSGSESDEADESGSGSEGSDEEAEREGDDDDLRTSFKQRVGSIKQSGTFERGLRRLRRLGILKDGGDAGSSSDGEEEDGDEDGDEGDEEGDEEEEGEEEEAGEASGSDDSEDAADEEPPAPPTARHAAKAAAAVAAASAPAKRQEGGARSRAGAQAEELPYTFEAPSTLAQFARYVDGRSPAEMSAVIERICACHAISLGPDNRQKMQVFFSVLLLHFEALARQSPLPQAHVDALVPHLLVRGRAPACAALHCS